MLELHNFFGVCIAIFVFRVVCGSVYLILLNSTEGFTQILFAWLGAHINPYPIMPVASCQ
jgi:hypothetical protein